jgi:hypothetical protein
MRILIFLSFLSLTLFSQDDRLDDLPFDDEPLQEESKSYFAVAGGYTFNVGLINTTEANNFLNLMRLNIGNKFSANTTLDCCGDEFSENGLILHGGGGFAGIPFWKNFRIGFEAYGGTNRTDESIAQVGHSIDSLSIDPINYKEQAELNIAMTAIHFDYGIVLTDGLALLSGIKVGWSKIGLIYSFTQENYNWDGLDLREEFNMVELEKSWLFVAPQVSLEWAPTQFLMFSLGASYQLNFDNPVQDDFDKGWQINRTASLENVPDALNLDNLNIRFGIYFGLFNY